MRRARSADLFQAEVDELLSGDGDGVSEAVAVAADLGDDDIAEFAVAVDVEGDIAHDAAVAIRRSVTSSVTD